MILDLIVVGLFVLIVILGIGKGAARMILGLAMTFVSFLAASWLGKMIAAAVYDGFFAPAVRSTVGDAVSSSGNVAGDLPWWITNAFNMSGKDVVKTITDSSAMAADAVNSVVRPIVVGILAIILTIILFLVINLLLHLFLLPPLLRVFRIKVVSAVNKVLGGLLGAVEALAVICMLAYILKLILPYIDTDVSFLNESTIYNSFIFYHFYSGNIFTILTSWM